MKLVVIGAGYVGLVTAVCLAEMGHDVTCVDVDKSKIDLMIKGNCPIYENGLEELMHKNRQRLEYTTDYSMAYKNAEVIFIAVGTPEKADGSVNLKYVFDSAHQIAQNIRRDCLVVTKSTVPIGTNDQIENLIKANLCSPVNLEVASNPEFLAQGTALKDTLNGFRIVIGTRSKHAEAILKELYKGFNQPIVSTDIRSAEMIKYASNNFLALKISYINEIANLCEKVGANIEDIAYGMGLDPRIGSTFLQAGIGYGGSCFPKDTKALHWLSCWYDEELKTVKAGIEVNSSQKLKLLKRAKKYYTDFNKLDVAVLGLTFKPETDDLRDAPSLQNIALLRDVGASIRVYDPIGIANYKKLGPSEIQYYDTIDETITNADICFIFTEWQQIKTFDVEKYEKLMRKAIILDGRNCYELSQFKDLKVSYESIGRHTINNLPVTLNII